MATDDRLNLSQLANDLAARDALFSPKGAPSSDSPTYQLPTLIPLSHSHPLLSSSNEHFDVDVFLLSRSNTSLVDLRTELRDYLAVLKEELVQLINDDYADFISLRTDMRGEGPRLMSLLEPLKRVKGEVEQSRSDLLDIQSAVQSKLDMRTMLREEKTLLHLLLKVSDLVLRLETMLLIASPEDATTSSTSNFTGISLRDMNGMPVDGADHDFDGMNPNYDDESRKLSRVGRAKHLGRIAMEYNQLLYHADKARKQDCAFIDQLQRRIDRIESTLSRDLDAAFSSALVSFTSSSDPPSSTSTPAMTRSLTLTEISEYLKIYDLLSKWHAAEDIIRADVVHPFVRRTVHAGALNAPIEPLVPRTPGFVTGPANGAGLLSPMTPFTPYPSTANPFARQFLSATTPQSGSFPHSSSNGPNSDSGGRFINLLESNADDPLVHLLNNILRFVDRDCREVIDLAEKVNVKREGRKGSSARRRLLLNGVDGAPTDLDGINDGEDEEGFDIMARVVWAEVGKAIVDELGMQLFSAGRPDEFQKNHTTIHDFLTALEYAAPSASSVFAIRSHRVYTSFERRWQLPVYFQLRWKEIVGRLEDGLNAKSVGPKSAAQEEGFRSPQAYATYTAIRTCWAPSVYIPDLGYRFWRLSLQALSRYKSWLEASLPVRKPPPADKDQSPESIAADETFLRVFGSAIADVHALESRVNTLFSSQIEPLLPSVSSMDDTPPPSVVLRETLSGLTSLIPNLSTQIVSILIARCIEPLQLVRSIPSQYRAMSKRELGSSTAAKEPSYFIPNVLKPLFNFLDGGSDSGPGPSLKREYGKVWGDEVFGAVIAKYTGYLAGMKKTEDSLRRYKKGKQSTLSLFGGNSSAKAAEEEEADARDEARIRAQMILDVQTLVGIASGANGGSTGRLVELDAHEEGLRELKALAAGDGAG